LDLNTYEWTSLTRTSTSGTYQRAGRTTERCFLLLMVTRCVVCRRPVCHNQVAPRDAQVYDHLRYEDDMKSMGDGFRHVGGIFLEAMRALASIAMLRSLATRAGAHRAHRAHRTRDRTLLWLRLLHI
jgi:hypothetical protein